MRTKMMSKFQNDQFHKPFIKNLVIVSLVTIVSMISVRFFLYNYLPAIIQSQSFASEKSYDQLDR